MYYLIFHLLIFILVLKALRSIFRAILTLHVFLPNTRGRCINHFTSYPDVGPTCRRKQNTVGFKMELNIKKTTSQDLLSCGNGEGLNYFISSYIFSLGRTFLKRVLVREACVFSNESRATKPPQS